MHLVTVAGLASGFAVFSGCTNGDLTSASGQQQKTQVKPHASQGVDSPVWTDSTRDAKSQQAYGLGKRQ
jgi:hypothetical protein